MPNYCWNKMTIVGLDDETQHKFASLLEEDKWIKTLVPCPAELLGDNYSVTKQADIRVQDWFKKLTPEEQQERLSKALTDEEVQRRMDLYGASEGYEWEYKNWGTKWGDLNLAEGASIDDGVLTLTFETAWNPAFDAYESISRLYPEAVFYLTYIETGWDFAGVSAFANGSVTHKETKPYSIFKSIVSKHNIELDTLTAPDDETVHDVLGDYLEEACDYLDKEAEQLTI